MSKSASNSFVFIFGISGATWSVINRLIDSNRLPNFKKLLLEGCHGTLLSVRTPGDKHYRPGIAWATLATGCYPNRHQITRFFNTADDLKSPTLWDIYGHNGLTVGLFGWPITWPPPQVNGFVIPSHRARDSQTWPPELSSIKKLYRQQQLHEREGHRKLNMRLADGIRTSMTLLRYGIRPQTLLFLSGVLGKIVFSSDIEERYLLLRHAKLELSTDVFLNLYKRFMPNLGSFHTFLVDAVSHRYWRYYEPEQFQDSSPEMVKKFGDAVEKAYIRVDHVLGRLLKVLPHDALLAVVSEHGMAAEPDSSEVGPWRYVIRGAQLKRFVGIGDSVEACPVARWIAYRPRVGQKLPEDTAERLRKVIVAETGLPLFQVHEHGKDEVIVKFNISKDVVLYQNGGIEKLQIVYEQHKVPFLGIARRLGRQRSAMHRQQGVLILHGPQIKRGERLTDSYITDLAPTILHAAALKAPSKMDGRIIDAFTNGC